MIEGVKTKALGQRIFRLAAIALALAIIGAPHPKFARAQVASPATLPAVDVLINQLADDDPRQREAAAESLIALGAKARPQVLAATHADDPTLRPAAEQVLLKLPWEAPGDPRAVAQILRNYASFSRRDNVGANPDVAPPIDEHDQQALISARLSAVQALAALPGDEGLPALRRLVTEEPSTQVRWAITGVLRSAQAISALLPFRHMNAPDDNAPLLALCGYARLDAADEEGVTLLSRAFDRELASPSDDGGEVEFFVNLLADRFISLRKFEQAADLYRRDSSRPAAPVSGQIPSALLRLLALQADHGSLPGLQDDFAKLRAFPPDDPYILFVRYHLEKDPALAVALKRQALDSASRSRPDEYEVGRFIREVGWLADAQALLKSFLATPGEDQGEATALNAHLTLASIAARMDDQEEAGLQLKDAMSLAAAGADGDVQMTDSRGRTWSAPNRSLWAEVHWHFFKAATAKNDTSRASSELDELVKLKPDDNEIVLDVVPALIARHRDTEARTIFEATRAPLKANLAADPDNATRMNDLAWLEAECGLNLDEALPLAEQAVARTPGDASIIDTLAHVYFARHDVAKAIELEKQASAIQPDNTFMVGEVKKFTEAATTQP